MKKTKPMECTVDKQQARVVRRARWAQGVLVLLGGLMILAYLLTGCATSLMSREPIRKTVLLQESPDLAFQRATRAMARMGGEVTAANALTRMISAKVHNAVVLNVTVQPVAGGASLEVTGSLLPNKVVLGNFDEVDQYVMYLH